MLENILEIINIFTVENPRYKLCICPCLKKDMNKIFPIFEEAEVSLINTGLLIAHYLNSNNSLKHLNLEAEDFLKKQLNQSNKPIAIFNIGILFEPFLGLNSVKLIKDISRVKPVFLFWENSIEGNCLYWQTQQDMYKLDFEDINLKRLNYEI